MDKQERAREKLNIAMIFDPLVDYKSGAHASTFRFAKRLKKKGHKIIFIAAKSPGNREHNYFQDIKAYRFFSIPLPYSEGGWHISFPSVKRLKKIFQEEKINVVHTLLPLPANVAAIRAANALGIKIVVHSHAQPENVFMHIPKYLGRDLLSWAFFRYILWIYKQGHAVVYTTEFAKKSFVELNNVLPNVVISNGVDIDEFKKMEAEAFFEKYNLSREEKHILFVGRLHPEKSVETLIKSAPYVLKHHPEARVLIAGLGHQEKKLEQLANKLGMADKVIFLGRLSDIDKVLAYNACDVFVLPSLAELEGMVVLEAMACAKPIVIANSPQSASRYFVDQNGFLFEPEDHRDLAHQITKILGDDDLREKMAEASFQKSRQYDINHSVNLLEETFYSVLEKQ